MPAVKGVFVGFKKFLVGENFFDFFQSVLFVLFRKKRIPIGVLQHIELILAGKFKEIADGERGVLADDGFTEKNVLQTQVVRICGANLDAGNDARDRCRSCGRCRISASDAADGNPCRCGSCGERRVPRLNKFHGETFGHQLFHVAVEFRGF